MSTEATIEPARVASGKPPGGGVTELKVSGMTCGNCARHVTEAIQGVTGVRSAAVNLEEGRASVRWASGAQADVAAVIKAVEAEGFGAHLREEEEHEHGEHMLAGWQLNLWLGVPVTGLLMLGEWLLPWGAAPWFRWFSFVAAGAVQIFAGARFYRGAWGQLKAGSSNMDTLVALGSTTAFAYSTWVLLSGQPGHLYFMEAAAIITLISAGHWVESRVSVRASSALRKLLNLAPAVARRRNADGSETETPVAELDAGELVGLRPGDRVPTDGEVSEGASAVDESMLTGESVPVDKAVGSLLYAGTVNINGRLVMRVTATGEETALAHIIAAVQRAQGSRANIQRLGDRVSSVFVPAVVAVALAAGLWWGLAPALASHVHAWLGQFLWHAHVPEGTLAAAFIIAAAVLIIACPCAMGLATPAAIMAGADAAAQRGILIRDGVALEKAGQVTAVLFDKTGTLTVGRPEVVGVCAKTASGFTLSSTLSPTLSPPLSNSGSPEDKVGDKVGNEVSQTVLILAAELARHSSHPISQAVARLSGGRAELKGWQEVPGAGVQAQVEVRSGKCVVREKSETQDNRSVVAAGAARDGRNGTDGSYGMEGGAAPNAEETVTRTARLGSLRWLRESGVDWEAERAFVEEWSGQGATIVGLAVDTTLWGLFAVKDTLKPGACAVIDQLRSQGLKLYLITGDNAQTAAAIAGQVGILLENVFAEVRPERKAELVKKLQQEGERVAFVGDGINDAPALEQADLGVAVSRASDIAREAADIILLKSEIEAVPESLGLARATLRTIKQNLFWAFFYNAVGIPLAALGFMSPVLCAAAMGLSDLIVIGNALRLRRWRL